MAPIVSGTSTERMIRTLLLSVLVDVFAVLFLWDGYIGYQRKNATQLAQLLGQSPANAPDAIPHLSARKGRELAASVRPGENLDRYAGELGPPSIRQDDAVYYLGPGGWLKLNLRQDAVQSGDWADASHTVADQRFQRWLGWLLIAGGMLVALQLVRVVSTRARLCDDGLSLSGRPPISFEEMTGLRRSGDLAHLEYVRNGQTHTIRLDPYIYKNAPEIAHAIAERKGFSI